MNKLFTFCLVLFAANLGAQTDIQDARSNYSLGQTVTVTGIITSGESLGSVRYLQDESAGIAIYPGTSWSTTAPEIGDSVTITGELAEFSGLLEIGPNIDSVVINSSGNALPDNQTLTPDEMSEAYEGERVALLDCSFASAGAVFQGNTSYTITSGAESGELFVRADNFLIGETIPFGPQDLYGIVSQFSTSGDDGYQILVQVIDDIVSASPINIISPIAQSEVTTSGFTLSWETDAEGDSQVEYGTSVDALDTMLDDATLATEHSADLSGLLPATVYYARVSSTNADGTAESTIIPFITRSNSSGHISVYFTKEVDTSVATIEDATSLFNATNDTVAAIIMTAQNTLDIAMYNINDQTLINAINFAEEAGVTVRYISQGTNANLGIAQFNDGINLHERTDDFGSGMHNKFVVIDRESETNSKVITGSLNFTTGSITSDHNNVIVFQEQSLARGFTLEFEEMWGGSGTEADSDAAKFGEDKSHNTPVQYYSGDALVEVYFSPSDNTTYAIQQAIESANVEADFATLAFTRDDLRDALIAVQDDFFSIARGVIEQTSGTGTEYEALDAGGVDVLDHQGIDGQMHHKYAIIDATDTTSDPLVLTGSHNWSNSAENVNDENTVVVHDARVANLYYQEFTHLMSMGNSVTEQDAARISFYPNPAANYLMVKGLKVGNKVQVVNLAGQVVLEAVYASADQVVLDLSDLPHGSYILTVEHANGVSADTFVKR